jgi:cation diffusion facilitator CzcD-associated flavoprotein CzcO
VTITDDPTAGATAGLPPGRRVQPDTAGGGRPLPAHADVVIVGSGFSGLATAIRLLQTGRPDFVVLERADDVGGTWRDNSYPGCACDVPSHLYSFSFAPNPAWSRSFSAQPEIYAYLRATARDFGVLPHVRFGAELLDARWDTAAQRWTVRTARGSLTCRVLVLGTGPLSEPQFPDIPGIDSFAGRLMHSARWDHDHDLTGERVAVVGTGASAIQFVPHVAERAAGLTVFQRTAPWVLPRWDFPIRSVTRRVYAKVPALARVRRAGIYALRESWLVGFVLRPSIMRAAEKVALANLRRQLPDPTKRRTVTPHYRLGCKRVLLSNAYYPALAKPTVTVETDRIAEITPTGVVTTAQDGTRTEHPADTIIFGTGFATTNPPIAERVHGADGRSLAERWRETGMAALHGLTVAGFPNLCFLVGPNTGLGHTSIVYMSESQVAYVLDLLDQLDRRGLGSFQPRQEVQDRYNDRLQQKLAGTVWNAGGCASWYLDAAGRNTTLWPTFTFRYRHQVRRADLAEYVTEPARVPLAA